VGERKLSECKVINMSKMRDGHSENERSEWREALTWARDVDVGRECARR